MTSFKKTVVNPNGKVPAYVPVYEDLYNEVIGGIYEDGQQLPTETVLSNKYNVSRNTLRQALAILRDDGYIKNIQGKGNFVTLKEINRDLGLETVVNPAVNFAIENIDEISVGYNYGPASEIVQKKLNITSSELTILGNNVYLSEGKPLSHVFMQIPVKYIAEWGINLNDDREVEELLDKKVFDMASTSASRLRITLTEESISTFLNVDLNTPVIFIEQILYNSLGEAICLCKFYLISDEYHIEFFGKKK